MYHRSGARGTTAVAKAVLFTRNQRVLLILNAFSRLFTRILNACSRGFSRHVRASVRGPQASSPNLSSVLLDRRRGFSRRFSVTKAASVLAASRLSPSRRPVMRSHGVRLKQARSRDAPWAPLNLLGGGTHRGPSKQQGGLRGGLKGPRVGCRVQQGGLKDPWRETACRGIVAGLAVP